MPGRVLDRDRHPFRFNLAVATTSGLVTAGVTGAVGHIVLAGTSWMLVALVAFVVVMAVALFLAQRGRRRERQVFLMVPASRGKHWLAELQQNFCLCVERASYDLVLKGPVRDYVGIDQTHHMRRIRADPGRFRGGFIVASEPEKIQAEIKEFCRAVDFPLVFIDVEPFATESEYPENAAFIGYRAEDIGEIAARYVLRRLDEEKHSASAILVIGGRAQCGRQAAFRAVCSSRPGLQIDVDEGGGFSRSRAYESVGHHLRRYDRDGTRLFGVFATNDEMALGAADALLASESALFGSTFVVGVDGTLEATERIRSKRSPLCATVEQDSYRVAGQAVDVLESMILRHATRRTTYLEPTLYEA